MSRLLAVALATGLLATGLPLACLLYTSDAADDLRFTNVGDVLIPGGTAVFWQLRQTGERGTFTLKHDLPVGAAVTDADVLGQTVPGKTRCVSRLA